MAEFTDKETYSIISDQTGEIVDTFAQGDRIIHAVEDDGFIHNYKKGEMFVKIWDKAIPVMMEKLTKPEFWVAIGIENLVSYNDNILRNPNGERSDIQDICRAVKMNYDATRKIVTSLKKKGVLFIGEVGCLDNQQIKIKSIVANPKIYMRGAKELREIDGLFTGSGWD